MKRPALAAEAEHEVENSERWLLTYADMITLLLALFIVLFAVSTINSKKFEALALGFKQSFSPNPGVLPSSNGVEQYDSLTPTAGPHQVVQHPSIAAPTKQVSATTTQTTQLSTSAEAELESLGSQIDKAAAAAKLQNVLSTSISTRGLVVQVLTDRVFFASDSATLGPEGYQVIDSVAAILRSSSNNIDVEGYTDDQPIVGGPYISNEELSAVRAASVATRLVQDDGFTASRVVASGFGDADPLAPNTTPAERALNRRIDIVVLAPGADQP
ncbi:MAG TPA: flagellar motor protein MotB [Acidimicrobiales bacterium]|nr:flagellar motor protein MotB [Acidimicrobiales bacterium]